MNRLEKIYLAKADYTLVKLLEGGAFDELGEFSGLGQYSSEYKDQKGKERRIPYFLVSFRSTNSMAALPSLEGFYNGVYAALFAPLEVLPQYLNDSYVPVPSYPSRREVGSLVAFIAKKRLSDEWPKVVLKQPWDLKPPRRKKGEPKKVVF
jgi:hypothetical protein